MAGKSAVVASAAQRRDLMALSHSRDRGEADRARALLLTLAGWTSPRIAEAFGVREDTVRLWRSAFMTGGVDALRRSVAPGPAPVKAERRSRSPRRCWRDRSQIAPTGPCRGWPTRSRSAPACASRARGSRSCCAKRGFPLAPAAPYPEGPPGCTSRGPRRPAPQAPEGAGRGGRYRALVRG